MNIGIIGGGAIANYILDTCHTASTDMYVKSVLVRDKEKYKAMAESYGVELYTDIDRFLVSDIDIVVEAATVTAVKQLLPDIIIEKDVVIISIGAFADETFLKEIKERSIQYKQTIYLPSGAIGGLDLIQNITAAGNVSSISLETRKPANTLIDKTIHKSEIVFEGSAFEAIKRFPKNVNVSIALAMAGIGFDKTTVTVIADPDTTKNIHTITAKGDFGEAVFTIKNEPLPTNAKTSHLAAMSIIGTLERISASISIGV